MILKSCLTAIKSRKCFQREFYQKSLISELETTHPASQTEKDLIPHQFYNFRMWFFFCGQLFSLSSACTHTRCQLQPTPHHCCSALIWCLAFVVLGTVPPHLLCLLRNFFHFTLYTCNPHTFIRIIFLLCVTDHINSFRYLLIFIVSLPFTTFQHRKISSKLFSVFERRYITISNHAELSCK